MAPAKEMRQAAAWPVPLPRELEKEILSEYRVEPGDVLLVEAADFDTKLRLPGEQTIQPDGTVDLGRYGRLVVTGMTIAEIRREVKSLIAKQAGGEDEKINVSMVEWESKVFYVLGDVNSPGAYPLIGRETVLDAIISAGGLSDQANRHEIILSRPTSPGECRVVLPICYRQIVQLGDTATNYQMLPGDRIFVPSYTFTQQLLGAVTPGSRETCPRCSAPQVPCPLPTPEVDFIGPLQHAE